MICWVGLRAWLFNLVTNRVRSPSSRSLHVCWTITWSAAWATWAASVNGVGEQTCAHVSRRIRSLNLELFQVAIADTFSNVCKESALVEGDFGHVFGFPAFPSSICNKFHHNMCSLWCFHVAPPRKSGKKEDQRRERKKQQDQRKRESVERRSRRA